MLDFKRYIKNLTSKYLVTERHMFETPRHTFAIFEVYLADMSIADFLYNF